jgi:hypothetical protein
VSQTDILGNLPIPESSLPGILSGFQKTKIADGRTVFEVEWSVLVTTKRTLCNPKVEKIEHIETIWDK